MEQELKNRIGFIYKITSPNNKIYIGQTINPIKRKSVYKNNQYKDQPKLWNNCKKYNWNPADTFEVIEECICGEKKIFLNEKEKYWVVFFNSHYDGLNCNDGGQGQIGHKHTPEVLKIIAEKNRGQKRSKEQKEKLSKAHLGKSNGPQSEETKRKISESRKGIKPSIEHIEKLKKINTGKKLSDETKEKMSESRKNNIPWNKGLKSKNKGKINKDNIFNE